MRVLGRLLLVGAISVLLVPAASTVLEGKPRCVISGTSGPDVLQGTKEGDRICGRAGRDVIRGGGGEDTIYGGRARDIVRAGRGHDETYGGRGPDTLVGAAGVDYLSGGPAHDLLLGRDGDDCLYAVDGEPGDSGRGGAGRDYSDFDSGDRMKVEYKNQGVCPAGSVA
jgi:Ca2+-binding RTX toxin-like protein